MLFILTTNVFVSGTVMHVWIVNPRWLRKRSWHYQHMHNPQFYYFNIWQEAHCVFVLSVHPWIGGFGFWSVRGVSPSRIGNTVSLLTYWLSPQDVICESLNPAIPTITSYPKLFPPVLFCLIGRLRGPFRSKSEHCFSIFLICKPFSSPACGYQSGVIYSLNPSAIITKPVLTKGWWYQHVQ